LPRRIGICRALHAYHHYALWHTFFAELGWDVVLSSPTGRNTVEQGVRLAPSELCLPVKAFLGHVAEIKDRVDALLLPRVVCTRIARDWFFGCPKAIALPDLTRAVFDALPVIVEPILDGQLKTDEESYRNAVKNMGSTAGARRAYKRASAAAGRSALRTRREGSPLHMFGYTAADPTLPDAGLRVGVVGHPYLLFDSGLSLGVLDKVRQSGARPVLFFPTAAEVEREARLETALNWYYELELLAAARRLLETGKIDGLLLVASFACGTGAVTNELIHRSAVHTHHIPTIQVLLDEHTGEAGLHTRIESFVDLLRLRKR